MQQKPPVEKTNPDKQPPRPSSVAEIPLWLWTSLALGIVSLVSLVYYFFFKRSRGEIKPSQLSQPQAEEQTPPQALDIIKSSPSFSASAAEAAPQPSADFSWNWARSKAAALLAALALAYLAQSVFDSTVGAGFFRNWEWLAFQTEAARLWAGAVMYLAAALIWAFSAPPISFAQPRPSALSVPTSRRSSPFRAYTLAASIIVYLVAVMTFLNAGENGFVRVMWGAGILLFVFSQLPLKTSHPEAEESPPFQWKNWLVLALILAVGFWLRFYQLAVIPDDLHGDMASHGWVARDFLLGIRKEIFGFGWTATPTIGFLPAFLTMAVFGNNLFGMQMAAVLGGTFSLFAIYLSFWRWFDSHRLAAITTALVAVNVVHIHFSRIFNMEPWPLSNFAIFLLADGFKSRRSASFGMAGVFIGFSLLMYTSGRALPFILAVFLLYALFFRREWVLQNLSGFAVLALGVVLTMGPALVYYLQHWDVFISRSREVYTFSEGVMAHLLHKYNTDSPLVVFLTQVKLSLLMFHHSGDTSTQFGFPRPMFNSIVSPLILLGLGAALRRWKNAGVAFVLFWLAAIFALGSVLTIDAPFWPRLVGILPAAAFLIAVALEQIRELSVRLFGVRAAGLTAALIALFIAISGYVTWNAYYLFVKNSASPSTLTGRYIGMLPPNVTACGITDPPLSVRETSFLAWPHKLVDIPPDAPDSELEKCDGNAIVWAISPQYLDRLDAIRARWTNGILDQKYMERFDYTMTFYLVNVEPPQFEQKEALDLFPSLFKFLSVLLPIALAGILVWFFFRDSILEFWRKRAVKLVPEPLTAQVEKTAIEQPVAGGWRQTFQGTLRLPPFTPAFLLSLLLPLFAVALAYFAQTFLDQFAAVGAFLKIESLYYQSLGTRQWIAVALFLLAAILWATATAASANFLSPPKARREQNLQPRSGSPLQIAAVFSGLSAVLLYAFNGETALTRWLWFAGLFLFLLSLFFKRQLEGAVSREESPPFRWFHVLTLSLLLGLTFAMRVYRLYDIPLDLSTDMASVGIHARNYLLGVEEGLFGTGWYFMPRMSFIPYAASMSVAGNNLYGLYFATVVMGTLNVLGVYLFVWRLFDRHRLALLTAVLVVINPAHIHFSRITSYVDPWFLGFFALFFLIDGLKGRRWASFALAGVFTGFTLVSYPAGRAIVPLLFLALACAWFLRREWVVENYRGLGWLALGAFFALGPSLVYFATDWSVYMRRSSQVLIFNPGVTQHLKNTYEVDTIWKILWEQTRRSVLMFNYYSDLSAQFFYPHPMFNSLVSPLLALGFGMSLSRWRKPQFSFLLSSFLFLLVTGSILTDNAPTWCRLVGIIPLAALFIALTLDEFAFLLERLSLKILLPVWALAVVLLLGRLAVTDWNAYFDYAGNEEIVRPEVHVARYLDALPNDLPVCGMTYEFDYLVSQEEIQFMGWPRSITVVPYETAPLTPELCPYENVIWILSPIYEDRLAEIQALWRGGTVERHMSKNDWHIFTSYTVTGALP